MSALGNSAEVLLLDYLLTNNAVTRPPGRYLALYTSATDDASGGTEVSGNGYARQAIVFGAASSPGGTASTTTTIDFTAAGGNWGTVTHAAIHDAVSAGNRLLHGALAAPKTVNDGDTLSFVAGAGNVTMA